MRKTLRRKKYLYRNRIDRGRDKSSQPFSMVYDGEVVLLSPACSSLDMFSGFESRGLAFKNAIQNRVKEN